MPELLQLCVVHPHSPRSQWCVLGCQWRSIWRMLSSTSGWHLCQILYNTLRPRQNGRHFADDTFKPIFLNENFRLLIKISLKFVPKVPINNIPALVQIMAWRRPGDKPLYKPMMINLLTHICVTRLQCDNSCSVCTAGVKYKFVFANTNTVYLYVITVFGVFDKYIFKYTFSEHKLNKCTLTRIFLINRLMGVNLIKITV